jgi:hypothetical protein
MASHRLDSGSVLDLKRHRGDYTGGRLPYGFTLCADGKILKVDETEQETIEVAKDLQAIEGPSLRKIGVSERCVVPPCEWTTQTICIS